MFYYIAQPNGRKYKIYRTVEQNTPEGRIEILNNSVLERWKNYISENWMHDTGKQAHNGSPEAKVKKMLDKCADFILLGELKYGGILTMEAQRKMFDNEISADMTQPLNFDKDFEPPKPIKKSEKVKEFDRLAKKKRKNSNYLRKIVNHKYTFEYKSCPVDTENKFIFCGKRFEIDKCLGQFDPVELNNGELFYQVDQIHAYEQKGKFFFFDRELNDITGYVKEW